MVAVENNSTQPFKYAFSPTVRYVLYNAFKPLFKVWFTPEFLRMVKQNRETVWQLLNGVLTASNCDNSPQAGGKR